ncbi:MAG: putative rRNA maturation factor [Chloroflexota bacterium]|nr:putative rRNA maturation factor [Chloroflexota bacterium]
MIYRPPWRIELTVRNGVPKVISDARLARAIASALTAGEAPSPGTIGLILTDDAEIAQLNETQMGHEGPTDVLSFPLIDPRGSDFVSPPVRRTHLGEMVVSVERAIEQAEQGRGGHTGDVIWSPADELRLLVTHGALHICGFDHAEPAEEAAMRALERRLLGVAEPA